MSAATSQRHSVPPVYWKNSDYSCVTLKRSNKVPFCMFRRDHDDRVGAESSLDLSYRDCLNPASACPLSSIAVDPGSSIDCSFISHITCLSPPLLYLYRKTNRSEIEEKVHDLLDAASADAALAVTNQLMVFAMGARGREELIADIEQDFSRRIATGIVQPADVGKVFDHVTALRGQDRSNMPDTVEFLLGEFRYFNARRILREGRDPSQQDDVLALQHLAIQQVALTDSRSSTSLSSGNAFDAQDAHAVEGVQANMLVAGRGGDTGTTTSSTTEASPEGDLMEG